MPRSALAYLSDIIEASEAIQSFLVGVDLETYQSTRAVRSAVEREFILIGEAVGALIRLEPEMQGRISHARRIVDFRNQLTHEYAAVSDAVVWAIATSEVQALREECRTLLAERDSGSDPSGAKG